MSFQKPIFSKGKILKKNDFELNFQRFLRNLLKSNGPVINTIKKFKIFWRFYTLMMISLRNIQYCYDLSWQGIDYRSNSKYARAKTKKRKDLWKAAFLKN